MESELEYKPIPVKDLLRGMKNLSWLMVNLAFSSIIYADEQLASEVLELEKTVDRMELLLLMQAALATRSADDAERIVSIIRIASATGRIANAAADVANVAFSKIRIPRGVSESFFNTGEMITRFHVGKEFDGKSIGDLLTKAGIIVDVLALRRGVSVVIEPNEDYLLREGDYIMVRGSVEAVTSLAECLGAKLQAEYYALEKPGVYKDIIEDLVQIRNISMIMVDIAYTAMLTKSEDIAEKVRELEDYVDAMVESFSQKVMELKELSKEEKYGALRIAFSSEEIADGALSIVQPLLLGLEPHPLISDVLEETIERISVVEMDEEDDGKSLKELGYSRKGISVLAVKRGDDWWIMPPYSSFRVKSGDVLIVKYVSESERFVEELEKEEDRREIIEDIQEEEWEED